MIYDPWPCHWKLIGSRIDIFLLSPRREKPDFFRIGGGDLDESIFKETSESEAAKKILDSIADLPRPPIRSPRQQPRQRQRRQKTGIALFDFLHLIKFHYQPPAQLLRSICSSVSPFICSTLSLLCVSSLQPG
jgi:hypothetical protein